MEEIDYSIHYKKWHNDTIQHYECYTNYYKNSLKPVLPSNKNISLLDVGCGFGIALYSLNKMGYKNIIGIDSSKQQIEIAKNNNINAEYTDDTISWLNNHQEEFEVILALDVIEHIPIKEQIRFLKAINNSLKKGGMFISTVPNANSIFAARWRYIDWTHHCSFTEHSLEFILLNSGFKKVTIKEIEFNTKPKYSFILRKSVLHWYIFKFIRLIRRIEAIAELGIQGKSIPLSLNIISIAEK